MAEEGINIEAIGVFQDTAKLHVNNISKAQKILNKLNYTTELREVIRVDLENRPGALAELATKLGNKGINIEYCYGTLSKKGERVSVVLDVSDIERATKILEE